MAASNNMFYVSPANPLKALMLGVQGFDSARQRAQEDEMKAGRLEAVQTLTSGGDVRPALAKLIGIGDVKGAEAIATYANQQAQRGFEEKRLAESSRHNKAIEAETSRYHSGSLGIQQGQLELSRRNAEEKPSYQVIEGADGTKELVRIEPRGKGVSVATPPELRQPGSGNPYMTGGKMTEAQSKDALYANRMLAAEKVFRDPKVVEAGQSLAERYASKIPVYGNYAVSDNFQKFDQAKRDFINAVLRRESGAVIADTEFANAERQYFPQPGDSKSVLSQKARNRAEAIRGIAAGAGQGYRPQSFLGPNDEIIDRNAPASAAQSAAPSLPPPPPGFQLVK